MTGSTTLKSGWVVFEWRVAEVLARSIFEFCCAKDSSTEGQKMAAGNALLSIPSCPVTPDVWQTFRR